MALLPIGVFAVSIGLVAAASLRTTGRTKVAAIASVAGLLIDWSSWSPEHPSGAGRARPRPRPV